MSNPTAIDWIPSPPEDWQRKRLKYCVRLVTEKASAEDDRAYVGLENIESQSGRYIASDGDMLDSASNTFERGDVLFGKLRPYLAKALNAEFSGRCTGEVLVLRPRLFESRFLHYLVLSDNFVTTVNASTYGAKMPRAEWAFIGNLKAPVPKIPHQSAIADYLDRETKRIDDLIGREERLLALLDEKRTALISHAVTKGLDPNAELIDSEVPQLGSTPKHWIQAPARWYFRTKSGSAISNTEVEKERSEDSNIPVIGGNGIMGYTCKANSTEPSLAIGRVGALCGNVHFIDGPAWITDNALLLHLVRGYDLHYLREVLIKLNLNDLASKTAQPLLTGSQVRNQMLPLPPLSEQVAISDYIKKKTRAFVSIGSKIQQAIDLLRERRTALISAAVTGKIDCSGGASI